VFCDVGSADVNEYLRSILGLDTSAKDFRTWADTALAVQALQEFEEFDSHASAKRNGAGHRARSEAPRQHGDRLPQVLRASCRHRRLPRPLSGRRAQQPGRRTLRTRLARLTAEEAAVLVLLQKRMKEATNAPELHCRPAKHR
jgi:DNA topoisomerase-1